MKHSGEMTWKCPVSMNTAEAYSLAVLLRLYATREKNGRQTPTYRVSGERYMHSPTTLTEEHVAAIGGLWAYICSVIRKKGYENSDQVDDFLVTDEYGPDPWIEKHPARVKSAEKFLMSLVGEYICYG